MMIPGRKITNERAIIFANGDLPDLNALRDWLKEDDVLIAADGGLRHIFAVGRRPYLLIGDLDSVTSVDIGVAAGYGSRVERYPVEKDETDLELAVLAALKLGFSTLRIVAALGGRLDQTLGNLFLLAHPQLKDVDIRLDDGSEEVWLAQKKAEIIGKTGDRVSLLPLGSPALNVTTQGLRYPLRGETLQAYQTRGISNEMLGENAQVEWESGTLIITHQRVRKAD